MANVFTFSALRIFETAARHLNFSRAAMELGITQPYISAQISGLEKKLGVALFDRSPARGVRLTEAGELLLPHAIAVVGELDSAEQELSAVRRRLRGRMRLAASATPGGYVLPGMLAGFSKSNPGVRASLTVGNSCSVERYLLDGNADIGVLAGPVVSHRLLAIVVGSAESALVVPAQHPWAKRRVIQPAELARVTLLHREQGSSTRTQLERELNRAEVAPRGVWELNDIDAIKHAVVAGLGVAVLSLPAVRWEVASGLLATVRIEGFNLSQDVNAVVLNGKPLTPAASAFIAFLRRGPGGSAASRQVAASFAVRHQQPEGS